MKDEINPCEHDVQAKNQLANFYLSAPKFCKTLIKEDLSLKQVEQLKKQGEFYQSKRPTPETNSKISDDIEDKEFSSQESGIEMSLGTKATVDNDGS